MEGERTCVAKILSLLGYYCLCDLWQMHSPSLALCKVGDGNNKYLTALLWEYQ